MHVKMTLTLTNTLTALLEENPFLLCVGKYLASPLVYFGGCHLQPSK